MGKVKWLGYIALLLTPLLLLLTPIPTCSNPPASTVGYSEHISGIQLGDEVYIPHTPNIPESGYLLFVYHGYLDDSWVITLSMGSSISYVPLNGAFTQTINGEELEVYNMNVNDEGMLSCDWKKIK